MYVLVDHNNVRLADRRRGPIYLVDRILDALTPNRLTGVSHVRVRLYDGWYNQQTLTRLAQDVSTAVQASTPRTKNFTDGESTISVVVGTELAYGLLCAPADRIWHTFRPNVHAGDIVFHHPGKAGCNNPLCPLVAASEFLRNSRCPMAGCRITPEALVHRMEQKLVDAMIAADLLTCYHQGSRSVVVVTSDDDLWPSIKCSLRFGMQIIHVHTIPGRRTPSMYCKNAGTGYVQLQL
jgi:hypothetical protein